MEKPQHTCACVPRAWSSIQYNTAQTSVGSHFCVQCCSSSDRYVVCRLARESMWSVQEIVKTPKREHRAQPYRILLISLRADKLTEVVVVEFLLTLQLHGHVAYCSFTRWLHVSRHEFQYVAPTHNDAA